jgi:pyrroloquinoline quinone biosynthesis protein B
MRLVSLITTLLCMAATPAPPGGPAFRGGSTPLGDPLSSGGPAPAEPRAARSKPYILVLGTAQDGGYPQAGCRKDCCRLAWDDPQRRRYVSCIAIVDPVSGERWIVDATPDFRYQLRLLDGAAPVEDSPGISGILLTHGHIGHYAGLVHLGREVMGTRSIPVYAMPRMREFLENNGPWDQLIGLNNISLKSLEDGVTVRLNDRLSVTPFLVPHRDEYTETVGYRIDGPDRSAVYISDIDKWDRWDESIVEVLSRVSAAYLDGTFYAEGEIPGRNMADIPHPFIEESMRLFRSLPPEEKAKVHFIHFNHTNPVLDPDGDARRRVEEAGYHITEQLETFDL